MPTTPLGLPLPPDTTRISDFAALLREFSTTADPIIASAAAARDAAKASALLVGAPAGNVIAAGVQGTALPSLRVTKATSDAGYPAASWLKVPFSAGIEEAQSKNYSGYLSWDSTNREIVVAQAGLYLITALLRFSKRAYGQIIAAGFQHASGTIETATGGPLTMNAQARLPANARISAQLWNLATDGGSADVAPMHLHVTRLMS